MKIKKDEKKEAINNKEKKEDINYEEKKIEKLSSINNKTKIIKRKVTISFKYQHSYRLLDKLINKLQIEKK
jgi:hypothetical protein